MALSHLNALRALESAVRLGSFRAAGEELCVTPAAVGQQVKKLEDAYGLRLLHRRANGFVPTRLAQRVCRHLSAGLGQMQEAVEILEDRRAPMRLSVSIVPTLAEHWLAPRLPGFWSRFPGIDLRIDSTHQVHYRTDPEFDFAIRYAPESPNAAEEIDLFREWLVPVCVPEIAARIEPDDRQRALKDIPLLYVGTETSDTEWLKWPDWAKRFGYHLPEQHTGLKFTHTTLALRSLFAGHGIHLAQLSIMLPALSDGRLVAPFGVSGCAVTGYPYRLACFGSVRRPALHREFISWVREKSQETDAAMQAFLRRDG